MKKSKFIIILLIFAAVAAGLFYYSVYVEPMNIITEKITLSFDDLPKNFSGYKIALLADMHYGGGTPPEVLKEAVKIANGMNPDIIIIAGDHIADRKPDAKKNIAPCMELLKDLTAPGGVFAVLGNHDHWCDSEEIADALGKIKITVLRNEHRRINIEGEYIYILGIDDLYWGNGNIKKSLVGMKYPDAFKILVSHVPGAAYEVSGNDIDLILAGHVHGGQIKFPFYKKFIKGRFMFSDFISGRYDNVGSVLYVTRGVGTVLPGRFLAPPEVTEITLKKK